MLLLGCLVVACDVALIISYIPTEKIPLLFCPYPIYYTHFLSLQEPLQVSDDATREINSLLYLLRTTTPKPP
jgi:hypothetical protein